MVSKLYQAFSALTIALWIRALMFRIAVARILLTLNPKLNRGFRVPCAIASAWEDSILRTEGPFLKVAGLV